MDDSITISKRKPDLKSMQYKFLRDEGIKFIHELANRDWTDVNTHDPGVTILEVLSYVMTDLGYRVSYDIVDILTLDPPSDIQNFFTARQILHNCPVTFNDYRKLMMDVDVHDPENAECEFVGVKNAWLTKSLDQEQEFYVDRPDSELSYLTDAQSQAVADGTSNLELINVKVLYDVLLEFEKCDKYGDLNENNLDEDLIIYEHDLDTNIEGLRIRVKVQFSRWDDESIDWDDLQSIKQTIQEITISFTDLASGYAIEYIVDNNNDVLLSGTRPGSPNPTTIPGIDDINTQLNDFISDPTNEDSLLRKYQAKVKKTLEVLDAVKATLNANRNLCEDFFRFSALKIEEILVCSDIELAVDADTEQTLAYIYHEIGKFLSPVVNFLTLEEMLDLCKIKETFSFTNIDQQKKTFTIDIDVVDKISEDGTITIVDSIGNDGDYTVVSISENKDDSTQTDIEVLETVHSDLLSKAEIKYLDEDKKCKSVDDIFEGPKLNHGFIDDDELKKADRRKVIHVSDLIQIIMDAPGVIAVREIQIANVPQDNNGIPPIPSQSVKWCLELAFDENYVPRLNIDDSQITFFKEQIPFTANMVEVEELIEELEDNEKPRKPHGDIALDLEVPIGEFKDLEDYTSIQEEFPLTYGIGEEGLTSDATDLRKAQAQQLKGFLMFFDQLFANYMSQLAHVKDLFSMNDAKDVNDNYVVNRSYFTQPLFDTVPNVDSLYIDKNGHAAELNEIAEDETLFGTRRNRFLNHLLGRFAEQFTDYALLTFRMSGEKKAPLELIEDKLAFLNCYPELSAARGKAFDYRDPCELWHVHNVAGLIKRASLMVGMEQRRISDLAFGNNIIIMESTGGDFTFSISNDAATILLSGVKIYQSEEEVKEAVEEIIINGVCKEKYQINESTGGAFYFDLRCDGYTIATSEQTNYTSDALEGDADLAIDEVISVLENEFFTNHESNRRNLACPLRNYFDVDVSTYPPSPSPKYEYLITYTMYAEPFQFGTGGEALLTGSFDSKDVDGATSEDDTEAEVHAKGEQKAGDLLWDVVRNGIDIKRYFFDTTVSGDYVFNICGKIAENIFATSVENNFNSSVADEIDDQITNIPALITVSNSTGNDGIYTVDSATADGADIIVEINTSILIPSPIFDGQLSFTEAFSIIAIDLSTRVFTINADVTTKLAPGHVITLTGSVSNDGNYKVVSVTANGLNTDVDVEEVIPSDDLTLGEQLSYTKEYPIIGVNKGTGENSFIVKGGADDTAVAAMVEFITEKFFSHEGFHLVEHTLLRPKVNEKLLAPADGTTLQEGLTPQGTLTFTKILDIVAAASAPANTFTVAGDITAELALVLTLDVTEGSVNNGEYTIASSSFAAGNTLVCVDENVALSSPVTGGNGKLSYKKTVNITNLTASPTPVIIEVDEDVSTHLLITDEINIENSEDGINDVDCIAEQALSQPGNTSTIEIDQVRRLIQDDFLPIYLDKEECGSCQVVDPYSCIVSVVLPYWQGRFLNLDFRKFLDRTIRLETPAHIVLNICWVSCEHMEEFETKYKRWIIENSKKTKDLVKLSAALNDLIDILTRLRNVYGSGTLHDCEEDDTLLDSIVLNKSAIGNA